MLRDIIYLRGKWKKRCVVCRHANVAEAVYFLALPNPKKRRIAQI